MSDENTIEEEQDQKEGGNLHIEIDAEWRLSFDSRCVQLQYKTARGWGSSGYYTRAIDALNAYVHKAMLDGPAITSVGRQRWNEFMDRLDKINETIHRVSLAQVPAKFLRVLPIEPDKPRRNMTRVR
jgi:hypothetical protein